MVRARGREGKQSSVVVPLYIPVRSYTRSIALVYYWSMAYGLFLRFVLFCRSCFPTIHSSISSISPQNASTTSMTPPSFWSPSIIDVPSALFEAPDYDIL